LFANSATSVDPQERARPDRQRGLGGATTDRFLRRDAQRGYDGMRAYCQSKLALVMFTFDLAESLKGSGVTVNCPAPGDSHEYQDGH
jgi:hypothetical protein